MKEITTRELKENLIADIADEWMLITAGNSEKYNTMTASWGMTGELWGNDAVTVYIRPQRYTREFADREDYFSLSFYGDELHDVHKVCGKLSGRDVDKAGLTGLIPDFSEKAPYFKQARLVLICKKQYVGKIEPDGFTDKTVIDKCYPNRDFHYFYVGKIEKVLTKEDIGKRE